MAQFSKALFSHPFSRAYWKEASAEMRHVRILAIAALCMALKMAIASFRIPVADNLYVYFTYLITAVQCAVCGPVVGVLCGGIGDLIEFAIHPNGPFFPGYTLSSMAGAYMLYSKGYLYYFAKSLVKNTIMLPIEIVLLVLFLRMLIPYLEGNNWIVPQGKKKLPWW